MQRGPAALDPCEIPLGFPARLPAGQGPPPTDVATGYSVEYVWRGTVYERMQRVVKAFAVDETSVSGYLYHK